MTRTVNVNLELGPVLARIKFETNVLDKRNIRAIYNASLQKNEIRTVAL